MATDEDRFRIRLGRVRDRSGSRSVRAVRPRPKTFMAEVHQAIRRAGGDPNRLGSAGKGSGRFNARGRGAVAAAALKGWNAWSRDASGARTRARRVTVKARIVKLNPQRGAARGRRFASAKAVDAHLRYLERDGVSRDGEKGQVYSAERDAEDGRAFLDRGRDDRHQFRFIVSAEEGVELTDLRETTRDLMKTMEADLGTKLDWIAVDHHNTGHPHTHILVRGVMDDGRILNIAGDYIAHGIRERASEIVTLELGRQTEQEVSRQLEREVDAERFTRLDRLLIAEQEASNEFADLRPDRDMLETARQNRALLIARARELESMGLATEVEVGRWSISAQAEPTLREMGERGDIIKTMHRALADHGLADERGPVQYATHGKQITERIVGRVLAKGLAGDELGDRLHLVIDGVDGRTHYVETADSSYLAEIRRGHIVALDPVATKAEPRPADINIQIVAEANGGFYRPSLHLEATRDIIEQRHGDPDAFIRSHVRRLEALRRAGHVERIDADHWKIPDDIAERGMAYDAPTRPKDFSIRTLSTLGLDRQVGSDGATWLDRELVAKDHLPITDAGFGREVNAALDRRAQRLVEMGHATAKDGFISIPRRTIAALERQEVERVGREMAAEHGLTYSPSGSGEFVSGRLSGVTNLASGRFAMIEDGLGFQLVPWQPVLEKRLDQYISGVRRDDGGIEWSFSRKRQLGLGL
jgi:type IV secretory pathway VirD2 relaxase